MFFVASKLLWLVMAPVNFLALCALAGVLIAGARPRTGRLLAGGAALLLLVLGVSPAGLALISPLEQRFPRPAPDALAPYGIIVLGGAIDEEMTAAHGTLTLREGASRLTEALLLARRYPAARLFYTGGSADLLAPGDASHEAEDARAFWVAAGIDPLRIGIESRSRNTDENARFSADILKPTPAQTWLLVTSAYHMPRSIGLFRKTGFRVVADPVDYRAFGDARDRVVIPKSLVGLTIFDTALHEWIGLLAYWATGRIDDLFPAP